MKLVLLLVTILVIVACSDKENRTQSKPRPTFDRAIVEDGFRVYVTHCQVCHGVRGGGAPNWRTPDEQGKYPPPPLNGTGHAWHHPKEMLKSIILNGTQPQGNMPPWRGKLTDEEIDNVITWFQSLWAPQVYHAWEEIDQRN